MNTSSRPTFGRYEPVGGHYQRQHPEQRHGVYEHERGVYALLRGAQLIEYPLRRNEHQAATDRVEKEFGTQNIMALVVPKGDTASEKAVLKELSGLDEVDYAMGLSNVEAKPGYFLTDKLTPRRFHDCFSKISPGSSRR